VSSTSRYTSLAVALAAAGAAAIAFWPIVHGYFWLDDFVWLYLVTNAPTGELLFTQTGGHVMVLGNAAFALFHRVAGLDPRWYFASMLATHLVNVLLLLRVTRLLSGSLALGALAAFLWGTCFACGATLAWYTAYAQVLATTCVLAALARVAGRARTADAASPSDLAVAGLLLAVGSLLFGTAIAAALVFPAVVLLLLPGTFSSPRRLVGLAAIPLAVLAIYAGAQAMSVWVFGQLSPAVELLLWMRHGGHLAAVALFHLLRVGIAALVLGSWWRPVDTSDSASLLAAGSVLAGWLWMLRSAAAPSRRALLALLGLAIGTYALIAIARGPSGGPLWHLSMPMVGATLRYHYAAQPFLAVAICLLLQAVGGRLRARPPLASLVLLGWAGLLVLGWFWRPPALDLHAEARDQVLEAWREIRAHILEAPPDTTVYLEGRSIRAFGSLPNSSVILPGWPGLFAIMEPTDVYEGRRVRFVAPSLSVYQQFAKRGDRLATLLVPPDHDHH
jgi:hypothetical protein